MKDELAMSDDDKPLEEKLDEQIQRNRRILGGDDWDTEAEDMSLYGNQAKPGLFDCPTIVLAALGLIGYVAGIALGWI